MMGSHQQGYFYTLPEKRKISPKGKVQSVSQGSRVMGAILYDQTINANVWWMFEGFTPSKILHALGVGVI